MVKKRIIAASSIAAAIAILAMVAVTFTRQSKLSDPQNDSIDLPPTEKPLGTLDEAGRDSQTPRSIEEVKEAWEERLMAMPGVVGVGIGLTKDGQQKAIKVYLNQESSQHMEQIPNRIAGHPVEVEIRGTFRAW
jgi:hypothetical protein